MAFTRQFGELEFAPAALIEKQYGVRTENEGRRGDTPPELAVISNIVEDGKAIGGLGYGEAFWHTDSSFVEVPPAASLLRSLEIPPQGGATYFLNMYSAYETLPEDVKERIIGMKVVHAATHSSGGKAHKGFETVSDMTKVPGARQPLVRTHPETGRKALFPRTPDQFLCRRPSGRGERTPLGPSLGACDAGEIHLASGLARRRSGMVGQSLRHASPRRL